MTPEIDTDLGETVEGYRVNTTSVKILALGDGLSSSVKVAPIMVHAGDVVYFAVKAKKIRDQYDFKFDDEGEVESVDLVQVFSAKTAIFVDFEAVAQAIAMMEAKIEKAKKAPGQGEMLRTCGACGWKEGDTEEFCHNGSPLHEFPHHSTWAEEDDLDDEGRPLTGDELATKGLDKK